MRAMSDTRTLIWDLPTRLFHWSLVLLVVVQFGSAKWGWLDMQWHFYGGYATLTLLLFRIVWGLVGSESARFANFLRGPAAIMRELRDAQPAARTHSALGGWSVLLMLLLLSLVVLSGLATSDDIDWFGPLTAKLDAQTVRFATHWHRRLTDALMWLIALHVIAIAGYEWRGKRLVEAMLHGRRELAGAGLRIVSKRRALLVLVVCAVSVYTLLRWSNG